MSEDNQQRVQHSIVASEGGDAKALLTQTIAKIEKVIQATSAQPKERSTEINLIKAEYLKAKYNVEIKLQQQDQ